MFADNMFVNSRTVVSLKIRVFFKKTFRELNWKLFDDYHYTLKISFDQLFYYSELILQLIKKFNPEEIVVPGTDKILIND